MLKKQFNHYKACSSERLCLVMRLFVALLQGGTLYFLITYMLAHPTSQVGLLEPVYLVVLFVPLLFIQGVGNIRKPMLLVWCLSMTVLLAGITYYESWKQLYATFSFYPSFLFLVVIGLFIGHALVTSASVDHRFQASYVTQFDMSWKLGLQCVLTVAFVSFFWGLLTLGAYLLTLIDNTFLLELISKSWFFIPVTVLTTAVGIHLTDIQPSLVRNVRGLALTLFSWLLPLMTLIVIVFLVNLLFFLFNGFWQTHHATLMFAIVTIILIFLMNTAYQDGGAQKNSVKIIQYSCQLAALLLSPMAAFATYGLYLRVAQYGWTEARIVLAASLMIIDMYAIGYTIAVFIHGPWLRFIERWNFYSALLLLAVFIALLTPIADPTRLAVETQVNRLLSGAVTVSKFDFMYLHSKGARFGQEALENLQTQTTGQEAAGIREQAKKALSTSSINVISRLPAEGKSTLPQIPVMPLPREAFIIVDTPNTTLPDSFLHQNWHHNINVSALPSCLLSNHAGEKARKCDAWLVNMAGLSTIMLYQSDRPDLFQAFQQDSQGVWQLVGQWRLTTNCPKKYLKAVFSAGQFKLSAPLAQPLPKPDLEILGTRFPFVAQLNEKNCDN